MTTPIDHETNPIFAADKRLLFILLCTVSVLLMLVRIAFIENETAAFEFLRDRPEGLILQFLQGLKIFAIPLVLLWKITVIAFVIWIGCFTFGYRVTYWQCWTIVTGAEFVFLLPELIKIIWFMTVQTDPSYNEIGNFYPLSMLGFFDYYSLDPRYIYPLKALNLYEPIYWFALVKGINHFARKSERYIWIIVLCSYVLLFLLWLAFYMVAYK